MQVNRHRRKSGQDICMKLKVACSLFSALIILSAPCAADDGKGFHPPQTKAERTLDVILEKDRQGDNDMVGYLVQHAGRDRSKDKNYAPFFTDGFVTAVSAFEASLVDAQCDGKYTGELCGYEASYISCGQDMPDRYLYQTELMNEKEAVIVAIWPPEYAGNAQRKTTYYLVEQGEVWRLDGVLCRDGDGFNMRSGPLKPH